MADKTVVVGIAEMEVVRDSGKIATYTLGSCVGVCLYDYKNKVAGDGAYSAAQQQRCH